MRQEHSFKIDGMDCAEEIAVLTAELGPVFGEEHLRFDLMNAKLIVSSDEPSAIDEVITRVRATGMKATPWQSSQDGDSDPGFGKHVRILLTTASGIALAAGFAWHALQHGVADALSGSEEGSHVFPPVSIALYLAAILAGGWFIFPKAWFAARRLRPDMNLLMTVAVVGAVLISEWFEAATVTFLFAVALALESWSVGRARRAIGALMDLSPATARFIPPGGHDVLEAPVGDVPVGARVLVRPGERIPLDGEVSSGRTTVNQAPITGESKPIPKEPGDELFAGTLNEDGAIEFQVNKASSDTTLARIIRMVEDAQSRRAESEQWVQTFARYYTPAMMFLALAIAVVPPFFFGGSWSDWFYEALVILVIACPCALVISTPVSVVAGLSAAARNGVLIKGGVYLEAPSKLRAIAMDKTGTLTSGHPVVQEVISFNESSREDILARAAALEASSEHPIARAVLRAAEVEGITPAATDYFQAIKGRGAEANIDGIQYWVGSHRLGHERGQENTDMHEQISEAEDVGHTVVLLGSGREIQGLITIGDPVRPESPNAVRSLRDAGIDHVAMLTGDNEGTARAVAKTSGVDEYFAELLPEDKVIKVRELVKRWEKVAMVGDGVNDAPAMAEANLGIAMGAMGTDVAIETADIALMTDDLGKLPWLVRHSKRTLNIIRQNIFFALGLKVAFVVLALFGLATLWMAIAADMGASLLVIFNGLRLLHERES